MNEIYLAKFVSQERNIRLICYLGIFALMALWEFLGSRRKEKIGRALRWPNNLALTFLNTLILRVIFPGGALWAAHEASHFQVGLFHWVEVPLTFSIVFTVVFLDWVLYYQHRAFHAFPLFWKIHRMHHTDLEVDVTTSTRFHTLEILFSMVVKSIAIFLLGAPLFGVFFFELVLNGFSIFSHSNVFMPKWLDQMLRFILVTPDMHRIHHSVLPLETNSNFGFIFSLWDRLLGTYRSEPQSSQETMVLGLDIFNEPKYLVLNELLEQPFLDKKGQFGWHNLVQDK